MESIQTKDLLKGIVKNTDTILLEDIKQSWELVGIIADKKEALEQELQSYKREILSSQATLKVLREQEAQLKEMLQDLQDQKTKMSEELAKLRDEMSLQKILHKAAKDKQNIQESRKNILPGMLKSVQIYLKDGSIVKAKPAQKIFGEDIYKKYRVEFKENHTLKSKISELELENKRLQIELRDFYADLALEGMGALESKEPTNAQHSGEKGHDDILATEEDLSDFKAMLKASKGKHSKKKS